MEAAIVSNIEAALRYVSIGWAIFPVWPIRNGRCACDSDCGNNQGKHPIGVLVPTGLKLATTDEAKIREWWTRFPDANIGLATGRINGFFAIDIDPRHDGNESWFKLQNGALEPDTVEQITGSGGRHLLFACPDDFLIPTRVNAFGKHLPGLDTRGEGGYIVVEPSLHVSGGTYAWHTEGNPFDGVALAEAPEWILDPLAPEPEVLARDYRPPQISAPSGRLYDSADPIPEGQRDTTLYRIAASMRGAGMDQAQILECLIEQNRTRCQPPLPDRQVRKIAWSASRLEANSIPAAKPELSITVEEVLGDAPKAPPPGRRLVDVHDTAELPQIETNNRQLRDVTQDAFACLVHANKPPHVFVRGGELVRVAYDEKDNGSIQQLSGPLLAGALARVADWVSTSSKRGSVSVNPPRAVVDDMAALRPWIGIPPLVTLSPCPVIGRDGSIARHRGYHPSSGTYITGGDEWPVFEGDGKAAAAWLLAEVLPDFPFVDAASRAHALALMLLPFMRPIITGPTPLHFVDAPTRSTGKTILAQSCLYPGLGYIDVKSPPSKEEEWTKLITTVLRTGQPALLIDNIVGKLASPSLMAVLTSLQWSDRAMGGNETYLQLPNRCTYVGTANNCQLVDDFVARTIYIRLDPGTEFPEDRSTFRHPRQLEWLEENRPIVGSACIAMVREWTRAGMPKTEKRLSRFESWSSAIGGVLQACEIDGFLGNVQKLRENTNDEHFLWCSFLQEWRTVFGEDPVTVSEIFSQFSSAEWLQNIIGPEKDDDRRRHRLGKLIGYRLDRFFGADRIVGLPRSREGRRFKLAHSDVDSANNTLFESQHARVLDGPNTHTYRAPESGINGTIDTRQVQTPLLGDDDEGLSAHGDPEVLI